MKLFLMKKLSKSLPLLMLTGVFGSLTLLAGCSGGMVPVTGKVTHEGKVVTGGTINLAPVGGENNPNPGRPAMGIIKSDGTFSVETDGATGALIGKHRVSFIAPSPEIPKDKSPKVGETFASPYAGLEPKQKEIEVNSGTNEITIELIKKTK